MPRQGTRRGRPWRQRKKPARLRAAKRSRRQARAAHVRRAAPKPWWQRHQLEFHALFSGLPPEYQHFELRAIGPALLCFGTVEVPEVGTRQISIIFRDRPSRARPVVMASGSERSRHRFRRYRISDLCLYYDGDPNSLKWTPDQRLVGLLDLTRLHLLKEAWWRVTGSWPSPEVHRDPDSRVKSVGLGRSAPLRGRSLRLRADRQRCWCGGGRYSRCHGRVSVAEERGLLELRPGT